MKKLICVMIVIFSLLMCLAGCGRQSSVDHPAVTDTSTTTITPHKEPTQEVMPEPVSTEDSVPQVVATYNFSPLLPFSQGLAWVTFKDDAGTDKVGVIDEQGFLKYIANDGASPFVFREDGFAYYKSDLGDVIIDTAGQEHLVTTKAEEEKTSICGHGDGIFILRKDVKTFSQNARYISVVDADGNIIHSEQEIESDLDTDFVYYGNGIFRSYNGSSSVDGCFLNSNTGELFREYSYSDEFLTSFVNGEAYFQASGFNGMIGMTVIVTPSVFDSESSYLDWHKSLTKADEKNMVKPALSYPEGVKLTTYGSFDGGYAPVVLTGIDNREYFTIVDENGKQQYEPIKLPKRNSIIEYNLYECSDLRDSTWRYTCDIFYAGGRLIYLEDETVYLIDKSGNRRSIDIAFGSIDRIDWNYVYLSKGLYNLTTDELINQISVTR